MKKLLSIIAVIGLFSFIGEKQYNFKFTESEANKIMISVQHSKMISAEEAQEIIAKMQYQANDSTLNPKK